MTPPIDLSTDRLGSRADDVYAALLAAHEGMAPEASAALNARLILLLANLVADADAVLAAIAAAVSGLTESPAPSPPLAKPAGRMPSSPR
ncbi:MAG TPA: DUF2783 domain-containing protein [Acidiphilium sp.]